MRSAARAAPGYCVGLVIAASKSLTAGSTEITEPYFINGGYLLTEGGGYVLRQD